MFFYNQRPHKDFPSRKDFLTVKCFVRILMTGQIGWSPDGLRMNNGTKEMKLGKCKGKTILTKYRDDIAVLYYTMTIKKHQTLSRITDSKEEIK